MFALGFYDNAIAALERQKHVTFAEWMSFALPLTIGLLAAGTLLIKLIYGVKGNFEPDESAVPKLSKKGKAVVVIFAVTMLIPFAASFIPHPSVGVLIAVAASLGIPFVISTPINAMVHGEGGARAKDFFVVGFPLMIAGCLLLALTGAYVLSWWFN